MEVDIRMPYDSKESVDKENKYYKHVFCERAQLTMSDTSYDNYTMEFEPAGRHGMNVHVHNRLKDKYISSGKNFDCLCRKLEVYEMIYDLINSTILCHCFSNEEIDEDTKEKLSKLQGFFDIIKLYVDVAVTH